MTQNDKKLLGQWVEAADAFTDHKRNEQRRLENGLLTDLQRFIETGIARDC